MRPCMLSDLMGLKAVQPLPEEKKVRRNGKPRHDKRLGKVHQVVFSPNGRQVVGILISRPDVAGMVKRDDVFCALDSILEIRDRELVVPADDPGAFDDGARARLKLDWDSCILWAGMDVHTRSGKDLGYISDVRFDLDSGDVAFLCVGDGGVARSLVGTLEIPSGMMAGYSPKGDGYMVVEDAAANLQLSGGAAAKAGEATARMKENGRVAGKQAAEAIDKGAYQAGRLVGKARRAYREATEDEPAVPEVGAGSVEVQPAESGSTAVQGSYEDGSEPAAKPNVSDAARAVGRQLGKTKGMWKAFKDEFDEASK